MAAGSYHGPEANGERFHGYSLFTNAIIRHGPNLSKSALIVYNALALHRGELGTFPGSQRIAMLCRITPRTVFRALKELENAHLIERIKRPGTSTNYIMVGIDTPDK